MAFEWITGGSVPQFWKNYLAYFEGGQDTIKGRFVVFDMETSGQDWREDAMLSVVAIGVQDNAVLVGDFLEFYVQQDKFIANTAVGANAVPVHEKIVEAEAVIQLLNFIKDATLVGHNINLDIEMINQALKRLDLGKVKNHFMDTNVLFQKWKDLPEDTRVSLDEVCDALKIDKNERNTISGNAYATALAFIKLKKKLGI